MRTLNAQVWILTFAYALMMAGTSLTVLIAGIIGVRFAPSPAYATLPIALAVVGLALSTLPIGRLQARFGRRRVFVAYGFLALGASILATASLVGGSFAGLCTATLLMGWSAAAGHQYRFAAMEAVPVEQAPAASSVLLFGGIMAAVVGPELAVRGQHLLASEFAGSYLLLGLVYIAGIVLVSRYRETEFVAESHRLEGRSLGRIMSSPVIILSVASSAVAYGVMSLVMTAGPVSMHEHGGHSLQATKLVLQSHVVAMYLPSLAYPWLLKRAGYGGMVAWGVACFLACLVVALLDTDVLHYWLTMVILGIGWNFLFLTGTNLLRSGYRPEERFKVQSFNDFLVFAVQGTASLSSGWFLFHWGWRGVILAAIPLVAAFALLAWRSKGLDSFER